MGIKDMFRTAPNIILRRTNLPNHIAVSMKGTEKYAEHKKVDIQEAFMREVSGMKKFIASIVKLDIPIVSFYVRSCRRDMPDSLVEIFEDYIESLRQWDFIHENRIKVSAIGKWYDLPGKVVEKIKKIIIDTKDYDSFFVNLCINYSGQEEVTDSCRLIAKQVRLEKIDPESIDRSTIKDNVYTSYFIPPDIIVITGKEHKTDGFMLWDCADSLIYFADTYWPEFGKAEFRSVIDFYRKNKS